MGESKASVLKWGALGLDSQPTAIHHCAEGLA